MSTPLNNNDPYIDSTGKRSTLGAKIAEGGGGTPYELPTASADTKGGIKIGSGLTMEGEVLNAAGSNVSITQLCEPTTIGTSGAISLSDDYDKYDLLILDGIVTTSSVPYMENSVYLCRDLEIGMRVGISDDTTYTWFTITDKKTLTYAVGTGGRKYTVYGVKF